VLVLENELKSNFIASKEGFYWKRKNNMSFGKVKEVEKYCMFSNAKRKFQTFMV
jgi:hypothetical protein